MEDFKNYFGKDNFITNIGIELLEISPGYAKQRWKSKAAKKGTLVAEAKETSISPKIATYNTDITYDNEDIIAIMSWQVQKNITLIKRR